MDLRFQTPIGPFAVGAVRRAAGGRGPTNAHKFYKHGNTQEPRSKRHTVKLLALPEAHKRPAPTANCASGEALAVPLAKQKIQIVWYTLITSDPTT